MLRSLLDVHTPEANTNSAGRNNDHPVTIFAKLHSRINNESQNRKKWFVSLLIDNGACSYDEGRVLVGDEPSLVLSRKVNSPSLMTMVRDFVPLPLMTARFKKRENKSV
jgi:hypothetical protein